MVNIAEVINAIADNFFSIAGLIAAPFVAVWVAKLSRRSAKESADTTQLRADVDDLQADLRIVTDYVHDLRDQIVELGGKPRPWPDGMRR